ncbi:hypothetical protein DWUX_2239 [Desulfovibrio diazotrophicus]|nr:hypothetical protein DWUX_2239 [Desulfovibrio diazotrophicus]
MRVLARKNAVAGRGKYLWYGPDRNGVVFCLEKKEARKL